MAQTIERPAPGVTVTSQTGEVGNIGIVQSQWSVRPADQRFPDLAAWRDAAATRRAASTAAVISVGDVALRAIPAEVDTARGVMTSQGEIRMLGRKPAADADRFGAPGAKRAEAHFTHYAFGQLCSLAGAPASYLRELPADLAVAPLQWGIATRGGTCLDGSGEAKLYTVRTDPFSGRPDPEGRELSIYALTGAGYGRIYDAEVIDAVCGIVERSGGAWGIPDQRVALPGQTLSGNWQETTTLYASDHDCFGFLVDAEHPIETPGGGAGGRSVGGADVLYRGFVVWNSEVGDKTFGLSTFYLRAVCQNRMIWGARDQTTLRIRHTAGGPRRFMQDALPALRSYAQSGTGGVVAQVEAARGTQVAHDATSAVEWLRGKGFTANTAKWSVEAAEREEGSAGSIWDLMNGVTAYARGVEFADDRIALERKAGDLMKYARGSGVAA